MTMRAAFLPARCCWQARAVCRSQRYFRWLGRCWLVVSFIWTAQVADDLTLAFLFGAGGWLCQCISAVFLALFTARQDYARLASISIVSTVVSTLSMLLLIPRWPQASTFLGCQALGLATGLWCLLCFRASWWASGWRARRFIVARLAAWFVSEAGSLPRKVAA